MEDEQDVAPDVEATEEAVQGTESEATQNTEGQKEDQPAEDKAEEPEPEEDKSPSKQRRERRKAEMERLRQSEAEARKELERVHERLKRLEQAAQGQQPPKEGDFQDFAEYQAALAAYKSMQAMDARQRQEIEAESKAHSEQLERLREQQRREVAENWAAQVADAKARYADFEQVALAPDAPITQPMAEVISASDRGADIAYYLGQNRQEAAQIAQMRPMEMAMALGAIQARLSLPKPKVTTETPDPIEPVKPRATARKTPDKMSMSEYKAWRAGQN